MFLWSLQTLDFPLVISQFTVPFQPWGEEWEMGTDVICGVSKVPILSLLLISHPAKTP